MKILHLNPNSLSLVLKSSLILLLVMILQPAMVFGQKSSKNSEKVPQEKQWKKVTICHDGNTIEINESALQAHLNHGDAVGPCDDVVFDGNVVPFLESTGKVEQPIGAELTSLEESFENNGGAASDEIFVVNENVKVLIEIVAQRGKIQDVLDTLSNRYGINEEFIEGGISDLIVTVLFPIDQLSELNEFTEVIRFVRPVYKAITNGGVVTSQGDIAQRSNNARDAFNLTGAGIKIGVLSDSYDLKGLANSNISNGDLPGSGNPDGNTTPVDLVKEYPSSDIGSRFSTVDEGRAMMQIIHDVAPGAELAFRTGVINAGDMAEGILDLQDAGCDIIVDDVTHFREPFFEDGVIARAVNQVTSGPDPVQYFTSAGNFGVNSYESTYSPSGPEGSLHDFNAGSGVDNLQNVSMGAGFFIVVLQWEDDYYSLPGATNQGARNDLDMYLISIEGDTIVNNNTDNFGGDPIEVMSFFVEDGFASVNFAISRASGSDNVKLKYIVFEGKDFTFKEHAAGSSTVMGHANSAGAITVGAVLYENTPAYDTIPTIASFSSRGGLIVNGNNRNKPDFAAPNGVNTTVQLGGLDYESDTYPNFFGTSAAAPHAAAVAALVLESVDSFQISGSINIRQLLKQTAVDMRTPGFDIATGSGFIQADAAIGTFAAPKPFIDELIIPAGANAGLQPFDLTIRGRNLTTNSQVLLNGSALPQSAINYVNSTEIVATIPAFQEEDPPIQVSTEPITPSLKDGGLSEPLSLFRAPKKNIVVKANNTSKKYGERIPEFSATVTIDGLSLEDAGLTLDSLGLSNLTFTTTADFLSPVDFYLITPDDLTSQLDQSLLDLYDYTFTRGTLTIEKLDLKITPNDMTRVYGETISGITYRFEYDSTNIDSANNASLLSSIMESYSSTFLEENTLAVLNRGRGIVNRGRGIVNRGRGIVNGTGFIITPTTIQNRGRGIVNGSLFIDLTDTLLSSYELDSTNAFTNRGRGIVNGGVFATGDATINRGRGIVNDEGDLVNRGRGIVNDGALVNSTDGVSGFENLILIVDSLDYAVSSMYSINLISGIEVTPEDSLHYIVPGGYFALQSDNFNITYGLGDLTILPDTLTVEVDDYVIFSGDTLPQFTSTITGYSYEENDSLVFSSISYTPESYQDAGNYLIEPSFTFRDFENYVFDPSPVEPGLLTVVELGINGRIAFSHYNDFFNLEIEIVNSDGTVPVTLPVGEESIRDPQFSPDGNQIAFTLSPRDVRGPESIWKVNIDGTGLTQLTTDTTSQSPSYSFDGSKIGFIQGNEIAIMNEDGSNEIVLTNSSTNKRWTSFSPSGQQILYVESPEDIYNGRSNNISSVDVNTLETEQITSIEDSLWYRSPVFLKDGSRIIYIRQDRLGQTPRAIMSMNPDGTDRTVLFSNQYITNDVDVSPDNTKLAFSLLDSISGDYVLYTMDIDGGNVTKRYQEAGLVWWPSWGTNPDLVGPDLTISSISIDNPESIFDDSYVEFIVANSGNSSIEGPIFADLSELTIDGNTSSRSDLFYVLDTAQVLQPGEAVTIGFSVGVASNWELGNYQLKVRVDANDALLEASESNNLSRLLSFSVIEQPTNGGIAYARIKGSSELEIALVDSDGGNSIMLPVDTESIRDPQFSPDGNEIIFTVSPTNYSGPVRNPENGHYYQLVPNGLSWTDANIAANESPIPAYIPSTYSGHLVTITNEVENNFVATLSPVDFRPWIGLSDAAVEGDYQWVTGEVFGYSNWSPGEPTGASEDYVEYFGSNQKWNDNLNSNGFTSSYVVEYDNLGALGIPVIHPLETPQNLDQTLWKVNVDGSGLVQLTLGANNHSASYSRDGARIAFVMDDQIAIMNADGTDVRVLTSSATSKRWTSFSPDGNEIVYVESNQDIYSDNQNGITKVNINTSVTEVVVSENSGFYYRSPVYLKDGTEIIFVRQDRSGQTPWGIMSINPDGTGITTLYTSNYLTNDVEVSPDNTKLAFSLQDSVSTDYVLYTMDLDGSNVAELYRETNLILWPSWGTVPDVYDALYVNIPDANFEQALIDLGYDSDGTINQRMFRSEAEAVVSLNVSDPVSNPNLPNVADSIFNLTGIEAFVNLQVLQVQNNRLTSLDLSQNTMLTDVLCGNNQLSTLDISQNAQLLNLDAPSNRLASLDLSSNAELRFLTLSENVLTSLDVSQNVNLVSLNAQNNQISALDISQNTVLEGLGIDGNLLTTLDVSQNTGLRGLSVGENQLGSLDVSQNTALSFLSCFGNNISVLDVSNNTELTTLQCGSNQLDVLDLSSNPLLTGLFCDSNNLTVLDVTNNTSLVSLSLYNNLVASIDVTQNVALEGVNFGVNLLQELDVSQNTALKVLGASSNQLTELDVSNNPLLTVLDVPGNQLTYLDVRNGTNENFTEFYANGNNLTCINVDDETASYFGNWFVDDYVSFNNDCGSGITQGDITIFPNPIIDFMEVVHANASIDPQDITLTLYYGNGNPYLDPLNTTVNGQGNGLRVDMTGVPAGIYILYVDDQQTLEIIRIQKE